MASDTTQGGTVPPASDMRSVLAEIGERADSVWTGGGERTPRTPVQKKTKLSGPNGRVAIVDACRTPFLKAGTDFLEMDVVDLASVPVGELVRRLEFDPAEIQSSIFGVVVAALQAPNLGREVVLRTSLPRTIPGSTVNLACASSNRAIVSVAQSILSGEIEVGLAGGADSISTVPITYSKQASQKMFQASRARSMPAKLKTLATLRPADLAPQSPAIAEYTTGETMGESCEKMAKENGISREAQDEIALLSHLRAARAVEEGRFEDQVVPTFPLPRYGHAVTRDNIVRADTSLEALGKLRSVFDKGYGTITAGNASPLTDGASAVLLMSEKRAKALKIEPLGYVRSWAWAALDPATQLLQGPAYAAPVALERAGAKLGDVDLVEMHEAFAAQILSNMKAFASKKFAKEELGRKAPMGEIDLERFNVNGGSISIGHPFGATGARVTMQLLYEMRRQDLELGLLTVCAAGGSGFSMVVER